VTTEIESVPNPKVACIVLNWNGWKDTLECLRALQRCTYSDLTIVVVDNGSTDDSVFRISTSFPDITILKSDKNLGFAGGNNIGIRHALDRLAGFIWLLNNDTKPTPDALSALVAKAIANDQLGAVASICYYADSPTRVQVWGGTRVNLWLGRSRNATEAQKDEWFDALYGASLLIRSTAFEDVGLLDPEFFFYCEETEFCLRLRKKEWGIAVAPHSIVLHKAGASAGSNLMLRDRYFTASALRLLRLHSSVPSLAMALFLSLRLLRRLLSFNFSRCRSVWAGVQDYRKASRSSKNASGIRYSQGS
jgi:GT2 family glycosyltransferase